MTDASADNHRAELERWLLRRGVPQLVEGYSSESRMDTRAAPLIAGWLTLGTILFWATDPGWPLAFNVASVLATLVTLGVVYGVARSIRGRPIAARQETIDVVDILLLGLVPAVPAGLIEGSALAFVVAALNALLGIGIIYVIIGFGLIEIGLWALGRLVQQLTDIVGLVGRTLPILLILVVFLLFAAELWEVAQAMQGAELAAVISLLIVIASVLISSSLRSELQRLESEDSRDLAAATDVIPAAEMARSLPSPVPPPVPLRGMQRLNIHAFALVSQLIQSLFVALVVAAFLVVFGLLAIPAGVQESWTGQPASVLARFELLGETRELSAELLTVSGILAGIVGLYFTGLALTDSSYRAQHFSRIVDEIGQILAVRRVYLAWLATVDRAASSDTALVPDVSR